MLRGGYLGLFAWNGIPVRMHVLAPLGWFFFNRLDPVRWVGMALLIFLHEAGHAWVVRRFRARVVSIDFVMLGGECQWQGAVSKRGIATIAWGGVAAQAIVLVVFAPLSYFNVLQDPIAIQLAYVMTWTNLLLIGLNLIPIPPLDGSRAWPAIPLWYRHFKRRAADERHTRVTKQIDHLDRAPPAPDDVKDAVKKLLDDARRDLKN